MPPKLPARGFSSFIAFYSCSRQTALSNTRTFSVYRPQCLLNHLSRPLYRKSHLKRSSDKRTFHATPPSSAPKDPYETLGVKKDATQADIKKTYFSLARKYHPDTNPDKGAREKFVEIQEAYDILKDEKKRAEYDKYGAASQQQGFDPNAFSKGGGFPGFGAGGFPGGFSSAGGFPGGFGFNGSFGNQSDLFDALFGFGQSGGRRSGSSGNMRGEDIETTVNVSFVEACKGTSKKVNISPVVNCNPCAGSGLKQGAKRTKCSACGGSGTRTFVIQNGFQMASTCDVCSGVGSTIPLGSQCSSCGGAGKVRTKKTVQVNIPAGVESGMAVRIDGAGDAPISGKGATGDLLVKVNVSQSKTFKRQGQNLYHEARIPFYTALLGGRVRVPTLDGDVDVRVPGGTQQGEEMVLKGRGVTSVYGGGNGDLFVAFSIAIPRSLTKRQREILQAYADDVEGRTTSTSTTGSDKSTKSSKKSEESVSNEDNVKTETPTDPVKEDEENSGKLEGEKDEKNEKKRATG